MSGNEGTDSPVRGTQPPGKKRKKMQIYNRGNVEIKQFLYKDASEINAKQYRVLLPAMCQKLTHPDKDVKRSKIKGLWKPHNKPDDFPADLPFRDPNNGEKMPLEDMKKVFQYFRQKLLAFSEYGEQDSVSMKGSQFTQSESIEEPSSELQTMTEINKNAIQVGEEVKEVHYETITEESRRIIYDNQAACFIPGFDCDSQQVIGANLMICDLSCDEGNAVKQPCLSSLGNFDKVTDGMGKAANLSNTALRSDENPNCRPAQFALQINSDLKETWRKCTPLFKKYPDVELILHKINKELLEPLFEAASNGDIGSCLRYSTISTTLQGIIRKANLLPQDAVRELKQFMCDHVESSTPEIQIPEVAQETNCSTQQVIPSTVFEIADGYSKLQNHDDDDHVATESSHVTSHSDQHLSRAEQNKDQSVETSKAHAAKSHDSILMMPARLVKKAVGSASEKASNYKQFVDVDSDDPLEKDVNSPIISEAPKCATPPSPPPIPPPPPPPPLPPAVITHPHADSSSEGHDVDPEKYKKKKDFYYQELEDEYGSKKCLNPTLHGSYEKDDSSDAAMSQEEQSAAVSQDLIGHSKQQPFTYQQNSPEQTTTQPLDRIVGHEYGIKPLLDDDELSDSEMNPCSENQPLALKGHGSKAYKETDAVNQCCPSSDKAEKLSTFLDPFAMAPFRKKGARSKTPKKARGPNITPQKDPDVFANAPFRSTKITSPPSTQACIQKHGHLGINKAQVSQTASATDRTIASCHIPPRTINKHSSPQSAEEMLNVTSPSVTKEECNLFGSDNFTRNAFNFGQEQRLVQQQHLLQQQAWQKQLQTSWQKMPAQQTTSPTSPDSFSTSPQEPMNRSVASPHSANIRMARPPKTLSLSSHSSQSSQHQSPQSPSSGSIEDPTEDLFNAALIQSKESDKSHQHCSATGSVAGVGLMGVQGGGATSKTSRQRHKSSDNNEKASARDGRDGFTQFKSTDIMDDENVDILYGSVKHNKQRSCKKSPREKPTTEFANLGFDDSEKDIDALTSEAYGSRSGSQLNISMDATMLRTNNNSAICLTEGSHTLPRMGAKKHRVLPQTPDSEPFTSKKKSSIIIFK